MRTFLFAATGPQGQNVTDNIDAETLSQARYKLELRGFTAVEFLQGELCNDIIDTFGEDVKTRVQKNPSIQEVFARDSSLTTYFKVMLKLSAIVWAPVVLWMAWSRSNFSFISAGILRLLIAVEGCANFNGVAAQNLRQIIEDVVVPVEIVVGTKSIDAGSTGEGERRHTIQSGGEGKNGLDIRGILSGDKSLDAADNSSIGEGIPGFIHQSRRQCRCSAKYPAMPG